MCVGVAEGWAVVGEDDGMADGFRVGAADGISVGATVNDRLGVAVGVKDCAGEGTSVGLNVGAPVGVNVGDIDVNVGAIVRAIVGVDVGVRVLVVANVVKPDDVSADDVGSNGVGVGGGVVNGFGSAVVGIILERSSSSPDPEPLSSPLPSSFPVAVEVVGDEKVVSSSSRVGFTPVDSCGASVPPSSRVVAVPVVDVDAPEELMVVVSKVSDIETVDCTVIVRVEEDKTVLIDDVSKVAVAVVVDDTLVEVETEVVETMLVDDVCEVAVAVVVDDILVDVETEVVETMLVDDVCEVAVAVVVDELAVLLVVVWHAGLSFTASAIARFPRSEFVASMMTDSLPRTPSKKYRPSGAYMSSG
jgi:hypothetical protein